MKLIRLSLLLLICAVVLHSCVKKKYDAPADTTKNDPNLAVQMSIKQLSQGCVALGPNGYRKIGDTTIYGVVVADDKSGNYYKQIIIEDTSGVGIVLYMDRSYLYNQYPVGRKVYVHLKDLYVYSYNGFPEIVYGIDSTGKTIAIPGALIENFVTTGNYPNNTVMTDTLDLATVAANPSAYLGSLVTLKDVQFNLASQGLVYAEPVATSTATNRTIETCDHSTSAIVRTSAYCNFQTALTPGGNGTITGIVSVFGSTLQFVVRDTTDVNLTKPRCN